MWAWGRNDPRQGFGNANPGGTNDENPQTGHQPPFDTRVDGGYLLDYLLQATDPSLVRIELDVYWAAYAGVDPVSYLQTLADRVALIHLKDMAGDRSMTEVGKGILDLPHICEFARVHGLWGIVENDHPQIPSLESARISLEYFR